MKEFERIIAGITVIACVRSDQESLVDYVFSVIESVTNGTPPKTGMTIQFGWTRFSLLAHGNKLIICEPDFNNDPLRENRHSIAESLDVIEGQVSFTRLHKIEPCEIRFDSILLIRKGSLDTLAIQLFREKNSDPVDSGWTVTAYGDDEASDDPDDYETIPSYKLLSAWPNMLSVLVLPPNHGAVLEQGKPPRVVWPSGP